MKLDFARNTKRNIAAAALNSGIRLLFPFLNRTLFLWLLGPEYLGLNGLFGSILGVLMLAELGFGTAVVCSMYKPIADDDRDLICAYLRFYRTVYRWVGTAIFCVGLCLMPFLRQLVHGDLPPDVDLHILYLIHLVNTSISYFMFAYRGSILGAHHRNDVLSHIRSAVSVAQYITVFLILLVTRNYYHYVIATVGFSCISNLLIFRESRRLFPDIEPRGALPPERRRQVISDVKSIFLHKVGGVISYSVDNLVISAFLGLVAVAAYGNYYYVVTSVTGIVGIVATSVVGGFGNKIHTETKAANFALFMKVSRLSQIMIVWCAAMMTALYQPFIAVWTKGDPALARHMLTPILMVLYFYVNQSRQMLLSFKSAAALWRQDRWKPIVGGVVNLAFNIAFVICLPEAYKLDGVILSTIIGYVFIQIPWETHVVFTSFFGRDEEVKYCWYHVRSVAVAVLLCAATWWGTSLVALEGWQGLVVKGVAAGMVSSLLLLVVLRKDALYVLDGLRRKWDVRKERRMKVKRAFMMMVSLALLALPIVRIVAQKWGDWYLMDFGAYCAVSKALFSGLNPFPGHMEVLMLSFGKDVPIVYPGQMLLFALPGFLWGNAIQIAYLVFNIAIVWFLTGLTLVRACGCRWSDFLRPGGRQLLFAGCSFGFMSSWSVMQTMRIGQIPVILALCLYGMFWLPRLGFLRPFAFAVIAVAKYSCLTVFAPLLFFKGHRRLCFAAFFLFALLSVSPVFCGNSLKEVYLGYFDAVVKLFQPDGVNHYSQTGITSCHLGFLKFAVVNQILKCIAAIPILWLFWRERKCTALSDTALLLALSLTMLVSYHSLHDYTLVFPLFIIRLVAFVKERNWRYFCVTAAFPAYLIVPARITEKVASIIGRIPHADSVFYLSNPAWNHHDHNLFPLTAFFAMALALWSLHLYRRVKAPYVFYLPQSRKER